MVKIYYDNDISFDILKDKVIAIIGFGNQGEAHALNLKDNNLNVICGLRKESKSIEKAQKLGIKTYSIEEATKKGDIVMLLIPDEVMGKVYEKSIAPYLSENKMLMVCHGFSIHFKYITPPENVDIALCAPKGPGKMLRRAFLNGKGLPGLVAVQQNHTKYAFETALAYGKGIGVSKGGIMETTFKEETITDLFGEQAVLCGGVPALMKAGFETLVEAGYQPEMAYIECISELKLIVDLIYEGGFSYMRKAISNTAEFGDYAVREKIINNETKKNLKSILNNIESGDFAKKWISEFESGQTLMNKIRTNDNKDKIEKVSHFLLNSLNWLK
jgi:ketol-acid reductoisomerase